MWRAGEFVDELDTEAWYLEQRGFFDAPKPQLNREGKGKRKRPAQGARRKPVAKERAGAFALLRAVDHALKTTRGEGLSAFEKTAPGCDGP
eukprot:15484272-Alexandrium_andersonii.AAC.1